MNRIVRCIALLSILACALVFISSPPAIAESKSDAMLAKPVTQGYSEQFDANTIACWITNNGKIVDNDVTGSSGMEWPKGTNKTIDYASGLWIVGKDPDGKVRTACAEYASEYQPGPIINGNPADPEADEYRIYKINSDGTGDWDSWPFDQGAPAVTENGQKKPKITGDQTLFFTINDADPSAHANLFSTKPMGIEVQTEVFGYNTNDPLGNVMFLKWTVINKSTTDYDSVYIAVWDDPDLGDAGDDVVGCDTTLSMGYCYNGSPTDATYGTTPPALGFDFFQGPLVDGEFLPMTSFVYYWNGAPDPYGDPEDATQCFNFMKGYASDGSSYTDDEGNPTKFVFAGDPVSGSGYLDTEPADRRFLISSGPFTLAAGDEQVIVGAKIIAPGTDNIAAVRALRFFDSFAQNAFDNDFDLPKPPSPVVSATGLDGKAVLVWSDDQEKYKEIENYEYSGYKFEGYNIYQGESAAGPWTRIATYDIDSELGIVFDDTYDAETGMVLNKPVAFGANTGLTHKIILDQDKIKGVPLYNYKKYYYAVSAYAVNPDVSPKVAESGLNALQVVPGQFLNKVAAEDPASIIEAEHVAGKSDGQVIAEVVNPLEITGHTYSVEFASKDDGFVWHLKDETAGEYKLKDQTNQSGNEDYPVVDGLVVKAIGPDPGINFNKLGEAYPPDLAATYLQGWDFDGPRWISGTNAGGHALFGGLFNGFNFFGSTAEPGDFVNVQLRFSGPADEHQQKAAVYRRDKGYAFEAVGTVPFEAWDVENDRQLNVCIVEQDSMPGLDDNHTPRLANNIWDMGWDPETETFADLGGREYIYIMSSTYAEDPSTVYDDENWGPASDVLYAIWPSARGDHPYKEGAFTIDIFASHPNLPADKFQFTAKAPQTAKEVAKANLDKIMAVPNPYYGYNPAERTPTDRIMRITNMPAENATIRIFDLGGNLIKVIDDATRQAQGTSDQSYAEWDLRNSSDVPVASGMYLMHIEVEGVGETTLKVAVINRAERLLYY